MLIEFESVMNSDSSQADNCKAVLKEIEFETNFQVHNKASVLTLLILFLTNILFGSTTSSP